MTSAEASKILGGVKSTALTPEDLRRRRLETFDPSTSLSKEATTTIPVEDSLLSLSSAASATKRTTFAMEDDDDDAELQAALALSLQRLSPVSSSNDMNAINTAILPGFVVSENISDLIQDWYATGEPFDTIKFHSIMWDDALTTRNDQLRWLSQGIDVQNAEFTDMTEKQYNNFHLSNGINNPRTMFDVLSRSHLNWGLQQQFGGPCGVLAAIQAEIVRLLVFGRRSRAVDSEGDLRTLLDFPRSTLSEPADASTITKDLFYQAFAKSLGILLARAALTPSVVSPAIGSNPNGTMLLISSINANTAHLSASPPPTSPDRVCIVLPSKPNNEPLAWSDLEPWTSQISGDDETNQFKSNSLTVYTISLPETLIVAGTKRQKVVDNKHDEPVQSDSETSHSLSNSSRTDDCCTDVTALEQRIHRLARVVSDFLLSPPPVTPALSSEQSSVSLSHNASSVPGPIPLDYFRRHGGVLLFVASLVSSRGCNVIREEFDDSYGSRLTSQFGHCAQELINLLLTGQAVSNVFDHTLKPSGDMECRGIQVRPTIGYLTELESLRLCEVGSFYKSPRSPIWVVGSTSHFTVLFGSALALKESLSDQLLEKCRRAFKAVEGGEENGFIASDKLGTVLASLGLDIGGDSAVQTLAASIEVTGTNIILWDDCWKATSRLMTGASIESVLAADEPVTTDVVVGGGGVAGTSASESCSSQPLMLTAGPHNSTSGSEHQNTVMTSASTYFNYSVPVETDEEMARRLATAFNSYENASAPARVSSPMELDSMNMLSDEELARKLQAQWDAEVAGGNSNDTAGSTGSDHAVTGSPNHVFPDFDEAKTLPLTPPHNIITTPTTFVDTGDYGADDDSKPAAVVDLTQSPRRQEFEQYGESFELFHYNGLRGGLLTPFKVTRLIAEEAVGASIALNCHGASSAAGKDDGKSGDLEDVLRTKWPACMINWLGQSRPCIN